MGQAKQRGTFEQRKAEAIKAGRAKGIKKRLKLQKLWPDSLYAMLFPELARRNFKNR